jgi:hypothetical protein
MMARKTINVDRVKEIVNGILLNTADDMKANREAATHVLEMVLHETGNYHGFQYLDENAMMKSMNGHSVGININTCPTWAECTILSIKDKFKHTDETRKRYF